MSMRFILASASPARLQTLTRAGVRPEVIVSGADEDSIQAASPSELVALLASLKAESVLARLPAATEGILVACDSVLELDGRPFGKPGSQEEARKRWRVMRGREGVLLTGHHMCRMRNGSRSSIVRVAATKIFFADLTDQEIDAYVGTGEPEHVAGAFTIDSLGGPFISRIEGDPHNVVGISLPLIRLMLADLGVTWSQLWQPAKTDEGF